MQDKKSGHRELSRLAAPFCPADSCKPGRMVIDNFVIKIGNQIKDSLCRVFSDGVQYQWRDNNDEVVIPDASINCNIRDRKNISFTGIPRFVMEVLLRKRIRMSCRL